MSPMTILPEEYRSLDRDHAVELLYQMLLIRRFEEKSAELYGATKIRGFLHLYIGEEAVAVGAMQSLTEDDAVVSTYREHGHALARGVPAAAIMAEMFGKREGCSRGRGGSMHLFDAERRFFGGHAIVGGGLPIAVGLALADVMLRRERVSAVFFGDGAVAEGEFHEALNLASLWKLPVLFLCENNLYGMGTHILRAEAEPDITKHATGYGIGAEAVDGMDVVAVEAAVDRARSVVLDTRRPYLLECRTYRFRAHSMFDPELYRDKAEVEEWKKRDPIDALVSRGGQLGLLSEDDLESAERRIAGEIEEAIRFAEEGTLEPVEELANHLYAPEVEG